VEQGDPSRQHQVGIRPVVTVPMFHKFAVCAPVSLMSEKDHFRPI
jgi:hypothetical protein